MQGLVKVLSYTAVLWVLGSSAGAQTSFPFYDDVENPQGTEATWDSEPNTWQLYSGVVGYSGEQMWSIQPEPNFWQYLTMTDDLDLSTATNPYLSFWYRIQDGSAWNQVEISQDGGQTWVVIIASHQVHSTQWQRVQISLDAFRSAQTRVRLGGWENTVGGLLLIDDIRIANAAMPLELSVSQPTNNGFTISWPPSSAADFRRYQVVLDTDRNGINDGFFPSFITHRRERRLIEVNNRTATSMVLTDIVFFNTIYYVRVFEQNELDLWNQGSAVAEVATTYDLVAHTAPELVDFEQPVGWAADGEWVLSPADEGDMAWHTSPGGSYVADANRGLVGLWDVSAVTRPVLYFEHRYDFEPGVDFGWVSYSLDGTNWVHIAKFTGTQSGWGGEEIDLSPLGEAPQGYIRFTLTSNSAVERDGWYIDNVEIFDHNASAGFPYFDDVEDTSLSEEEWIGTLWQLYSGVVANSGEQMWSIRPERDLWQYLTMAGSIDLSTETNPYLSYWYRNQGGTVWNQVEVSRDGGRTWEILISSHQVTTAQWQRVQISLDAYRSTETRLRLGGWQDVNGAMLLVDDIRIDNAPPPIELNVSQPTNNGFTLSWSPSSAANFRRYHVVIDTDFNGSKDGLSPAFVAHRRQRQLIEVTERGATSMVLTDLAFFNTLYYVRVFEQNDLDLWNQGSAVAEVTTAYDLVSHTGQELVDFETPVGWAADGSWSQSQEGDEGMAWRTSPGGLYAANANRGLVALWDLSAVARPVLRFEHRYDFDPGFDFGWVSHSLDGINWVNIAKFGGAQLAWGAEELDLSPLGGAARGYIRFILTSNSAVERDGWHIDNVEIVENLHGAPFEFFDDGEGFASRQRWIGSLWQQLSGEAYSGEQMWMLKPERELWQYLTMAGSLDLTLIEDPVLSFWVRTQGGAVWSQVEVSRDGGKTWEILINSNSINTAQWQQVQVSLANYRSNQVRVRLGGWMNSGGAQLLIDDVSIDRPPTLFGDVSGDGVVGVMDAVLVLWHAAGLQPLQGPSLFAADVSGNGLATAYDATLILQFAAGLLDSFPVEGPTFKLAQETGRLRWDTPQQVGEHLVLPLVLQAERAHVHAVTIEVPFDPTQIEIVAVETDLPEGWHWAHSVDENVLGLSLAGTEPIEPGPLGQVRVKVLGQGIAWGGTGAVGERPLAELASVELGAKPLDFALEQNFPNPFNPSTRIAFSLAGRSPVELVIYNIVGQKVRTLTKGEWPAGHHALGWDGRDQLGKAVETGVYFYRLETPSFVQTRKMLLVH